MTTSSLPYPEFRLTSVTTSPFEPRRRSLTFKEDEALARVREHLENNLQGRFTLSDAAEIAGFERTYFSAYFHKKVGITFVRWMNALRIAHSIELLRSQNDSIKEVARQVGYGDLRTFERNFRRLTGHTPSVFREQSKRLKMLQEDGQSHAGVGKVAAAVPGPEAPEGSESKPGKEPAAKSSAETAGWGNPTDWVSSTS